MALHLFVIVLNVTAAAVFLMISYFWVKARVCASLTVDDGERVLAPFRSVSWVFIGIIAVTSVGQIYYLWVAASTQERLASLIQVTEKQQQQAVAVDELRSLMRRVRVEMDSQFKGLRAQMPARPSPIREVEVTAEPAPAVEKPVPRPPLISMDVPRRDIERRAFAREARASSAMNTPSEPKVALEPPTEEVVESHSMRLSRQGRVTTDQVRVRREPGQSGHVIDKLMAGQQVKVTEKRVQGEDVWFKVVTPSGRAGWVGYRFVKLEGNV